MDLLEAEVAAIEAEYGIDNRWQPSDFLYKQTVDYIATRRYQRALGKLQRLVIQRLFELHKLNVAKTGEICMAIIQFSDVTMSAQVTRLAHI